MEEFKGELKGFPKEVVDLMLMRQVEQGNKRDLELFEKNRFSTRDRFTWGHTPEGTIFWDRVLSKRDFKLFFKTYPKKDILKLTKKTEMVKEHKINKTQAKKLYRVAPPAWKETVLDTLKMLAVEPNITINGEQFDKLKNIFMKVNKNLFEDIFGVQTTPYKKGQVFDNLGVKYLLAHVSPEDGKGTLASLVSLKDGNRWSSSVQVQSNVLTEEQWAKITAGNKNFKPVLQ